MPQSVRGRIEWSFLELIAVVTLIAVLIGVAADRLRTLPAIAEHVAVNEVLGGLRSAIGIEVAKDVAEDNMQGIAGLAGRNPMELLAEVPGNYVGQRSGPARVSPGQWYFNRRDGYLVYRVRSTEAFGTRLAGPPRARFVLRVVQDQDRGRSQIAGVRLQPVEPYRWTR